MKKNILITGSTDGIGKLTAIKLAKEGHRVFLHGRNPEKLQNTITEIKTLSNNNEIDGFVTDFSSLNSVSLMSKEIKSKLNHIDVLINNAGIFKTINTKNDQGIDIRFSVNYLAPYLLTQNILPLLKNGDHTRVINLSSAAQAPFTMDDLKGLSSLSNQNAYAQSKLALTMWSFYFAQKHNFLSVIAVNPGSLLNTKMANEAYGQHWSSADKGATILHELATSEKFEGITEKYFDNDKGYFNNANTDAYDATKIDQLITTTTTIIKDFIQ